MTATIVIPSYKRAGKVRSAGLFPKALTPRVMVPQSQVEAYQDAQPDLYVVGIPEQFDGHGMAVKRNYVLDHTEGNVVMVDDDVLAVRRWEAGTARTLTSDEVGELVETGFELATAMQAALWAPNIKADPRAYSKMRPFSLLSPILGPWTAVCRPLAETLRYDGRFYGKEDYDFWLQAIYWHRRTLRLNQFHIVKHEEQSGGLTRSHAQELAEARLIEKKWGGVITYGSGKSILDGTVHMPIAGC